jgi:hypothetical protein
MSELDATTANQSMDHPPVAAPEQSGRWSLIEPAVAAAAAIPSLAGTPAGSLNIEAFRDELRRRCADVSRGDLTGLEEVLTAQAVVLHALFAAALGGAQQHLLEEPESGERLLRLALRAQAQTVRVVEALAAMKRPQIEAPQFPLVSIKLGECGSSRTEKSGGPDHELRSNTRAPAPALRNDPPLAPVGTRDRPALAIR